MADRWMTRDEVAAYIKKRVDYLPRLQRAGKIPAPSYHFGPRSPLWDRFELDALIAPMHNPAPQAVTTEQVVDEILSGKFSRRPKGAGRRDGPGIPLSAEAKGR